MYKFRTGQIGSNLMNRSAIHLASNTQVAIKRINPFEHPMFIYRTLREIKLLRHFQYVTPFSIRGGTDV